MKRIYETTHFSLARESLVYNFFASMSEALEFVALNEGTEGVVSLHALSRLWDDNQAPSTGTRARIVAHTHSSKGYDNLDVSEHVL